MIFWGNENPKLDSSDLSKKIINNEEYDNNFDKSVEVKIQELNYRKSYRDPFYSVKKNGYKNSNKSKEFKTYKIEKLLPEKIEIRLPFKLLGIIGDKEKRLAILKIGERTKIIDKNYQYNHIKILDILTDKIILKFKKIKLDVRPGSDIGVS